MPEPPGNCIVSNFQEAVPKSGGFPPKLKPSALFALGQLYTYTDLRSSIFKSEVPCQMSAKRFSVAALLSLIGGLSFAEQAHAIEAASLESPASICAHGGKEDGRSVLTSMQEKARHLKGYSFESNLTTIKDGKRIVELGKFYFKSPNLVRFEVTKAGSRSGAVVVKQSDGKIRGHLGGALSGIKVSLTPDSKLLKSANGFNILESDLVSLISDAKSKSASRKCLSIAEAQNEQIVELLEGDGDITDRIAVSNEKLPEVWTIFSDNKLLSILKFQNLQERNDLSDSLFSMGGQGSESKGLEGNFEDKRSNISRLIEKDADGQILTAGLLREVEHVIDDLKQESAGIKRSITAADANAQALITTEKSKEQSGWTGNSRVKLMAAAINLENLLSAIKPVPQAVLAKEKNKGKETTVSQCWQESIAACKDSITALMEDAERESPDAESTRDNYAKLEKTLEQLDSARRQTLGLI